MTNLFRGYMATPEIEEQDLMWFINYIPVNLVDFALLSHLHARAFGVKTACDPECWQRQWLNRCAREQVWEILFSVQQNLMVQKRFTLGPMYLSEEIMWSPDSVLQARFNYIEKLNVVPSFNELGTVNISPFVESTVTLVNNGSFVEARVPLSKVHNPKNIFFRESGLQYNATVWSMRIPQEGAWGYPAKISPNWSFAMRDDITTSSTLMAQDCDYAYVDVTPEAGVDIKDIVFMHNEQDQIIPQALPPQEINENTWRFWFYYWSLKLPDFADDPIDLTLEKEFDKFYTSVRYGVIEEITTPATIYLKPTDCCTSSIEDTTSLAMGSLLDGETGTFYLEPVRALETDPVTYERVCDNCSGLCDGYPYKTKIYYKTNPYHYGILIGGIEQMRRAIVAKVAANLPLETCDCSLVDGSYIDTMRKELPQVAYPALSQPVYYYDYGFRYGDREFLHAMSNLTVRKRVKVV